MQLTYVLQVLEPTKYKESLILANIKQVVQQRMMIAENLKNDKNKLSSADFKIIQLPSAVKNQNIREVKALFNLFKKSNSKKENLTFKENQPLCFNNQNYKIDKHFISFPLFVNGKSKRITLPVIQNERFNELCSLLENGAKKGKASLFHKRGKWYFAVTIKKSVESVNHRQVMGIDIGLRQLAVASVFDISKNIECNRQFHNGKQVGFIRKKYRATRRMLGRVKQPKAIKRISDKESRWMTDQNHKISRQLINLAVQEQVSVIIMEKLDNIRQTAKSLNKADRSIHNWAFFELQHFIEYKAKANGMSVVFIDPKYTSQRCSTCQKINKANRNKNSYRCSCGNHIHADLNASRNIAKAYKETEQQSA